MNEIITREDIKIEDMILEIRGKQVMFASSVAKLYKKETLIDFQKIFVLNSLKANINF